MQMHDKYHMLHIPSLPPDDEWLLYAKHVEDRFFSTGATTHCGFVFCSPLAGYSLLAYEVS